MPSEMTPESTGSSTQSTNTENSEDWHPLEEKEEVLELRVTENKTEDQAEELTGN